MFILHAEHEMNCSTASVRHLASSGVDVYIAVAGAVGALYGPLHGGANEAVLRMLSRIGSVANISKFLEGVKSKKVKRNSGKQLVMEWLVKVIDEVIILTFSPGKAFWIRPSCV